MALEFEDMYEFSGWIAWNCLSQTPNNLKNPALAIALPTSEVIEDLLQNSGLVFAPGLLEVCQSETGPAISYFKQLECKSKQVWAVYVLVLEKAGCKPKIYIGIGTEKRSGVATRLSQYRRRENVSKFVQLALDAGWCITHTGLLCWAPLPAAADRCRLRALFLVLETVFSLLFWAMVSKTKDYGLPQLCPWPRDTLEYDGCYGHISLYEGLYYMDELLTAEEINELEAERKLRNSRRDAIVRGKERLRSSAFRTRQKALATRKWACDLCKVAFGAQNQLKHHLTLKKHLDKVAGAQSSKQNLVIQARHNAAVASKKFYCEPCDYAASTSQHYKEHLKRKKHLEKVASSSS
jgi:hypothetical protein